MKSVKQYVLLVDNRRNCVSDEQGQLKHLYRRNTAGRYRVAAKTEKEAIELLREKIGFGSIQVYYEDKNPTSNKILAYKEIKKEDYKDGLLNVKHATDQIVEFVDYEER